MLFQSVSLTWRSGACRFHLLAADIQMRGMDLIWMIGYQDSSSTNVHQETCPISPNSVCLADCSCHCDCKTWGWFHWSFGSISSKTQESHSVWICCTDQDRILHTASHDPVTVVHVQHSVVIGSSDFKHDISFKLFSCWIFPKRC